MCAGPALQLVELKILGVELPGDLKNAQWLARVAGQLAATLHTLQMSQSGLEGELPGDLGKLRHLVSLNFTKNRLEGKLQCPPYNFALETFNYLF